ncbi:2-dehydropantoate 2-reductase [Halobacillus naozhouensis]|uniref:2-dehydropantoate 2-reductase n=1 Tax=Halobacillus naozhouensis TaxID=554880 RepID=A0ABY8J2B3_9BACI|nr:2-dehydropantoate 2-reductase [Halobacillus naozhouensis]WFT76635.1 2-dehydropantoate 2-reductase [Halobacillus naozhouensis]
MEVGIIGGGAIGLLIASHLHEVHKVTLYVKREEQREALNRNGVFCSSLRHTAYVDVQLFTGQRMEHDLVILAVKQQSLGSVIDNLSTEAALLFLQNGMDHLEPISNLSNPCLIGIVEHGALKERDTDVLHTGKGKIVIAAHHGLEAIEDWAARLSTAEFPFVTGQAYFPILAKKLVVNTVINPLTALFHVNNRALMDNPSIQSLAKQLCKEACHVLDLSYSEQWERVAAVAYNTGENQSSMLQDIRLGRKTEVDAICGYIVKSAKGEAPFHEFVMEAIHALEIQSDRGEAL